MTNNSEIKFKWFGKNMLKGFIGSAYVTTVRISDMPYKYRWDGDVLRFGGPHEAYAVSKEELPRQLATYFATHDFVDYDKKDLWWEMGFENLVAWVDTAYAVGDD